MQERNPPECLLATNYGSSEKPLYIIAMHTIVQHSITSTLVLLFAFM